MVSLSIKDPSPVAKDMPDNNWTNMTAEDKGIIGNETTVGNTWYIFTQNISILELKSKS